ncbi:D-Ala-D-Ala carboxypeptidase family metallohydrolase [Microbulbifer variabilis]|uniref:D-Ala-D-Ala carboxypeptidase family metallohydrolase n=1 Tax=Microbulbifer variabilis TaxID=266805 RepID=UPI003CCBC3A3
MCGLFCIWYPLVLKRLIKGGVVQPLLQEDPLSNDTLLSLIKVREQFNRPIVINSGYRCLDQYAYIGFTI